MRFSRRGMLIAVSPLLFCCGLCLFLPTPLFQTHQVTALTEIKFPESAVLVSGYDLHPTPSLAMVAKVRIPRKDLSAFQTQPRLKPLHDIPATQIPAHIAANFENQGWSLRNVRHLQTAEFVNGSFTSVWIDGDDAQTATVYIDFYEP
jgi:hypothetical protein